MKPVSLLLARPMDQAPQQAARIEQGAIVNYFCGLVWFFMQVERGMRASIV
jgi:hypothetical protein